MPCIAAIFQTPTIIIIIINACAIEASLVNRPKRSITPVIISAIARIKMKCAGLMGSKSITQLLLTAVAGAECNTVIELKLEHHAA